MSLYKDNNRVRKISVFINDNERKEFVLNDNTLSWQFIEHASFAMSVTEIYHGAKYNDTCIAEYNVYSSEYGWLFGDINE
jgi:hypothetical protein